MTALAAVARSALILPALLLGGTPPAIAQPTNAPGAAPPPEATPTAPDPLSFVDGSWTLVVLPDTQIYCRDNPELFAAQTRWIVDHADEHDIRYVVHLGDLVHNNNDTQWAHARDAMAILNGRVPYALVPGNHDYGPGGSANTRDTLLNQYFPMEWFRDWPSLGGVMEPGRIDNSYHLFEAGGEKWLILALEWGPRDETVVWANQIAEQHPDRSIILLTHAYLYSDGTRYDWATHGETQKWNPHAYKTARLPGGVNDGQVLWDKLVKRHPGFRFTLNGHVLNDGTGRLTSTGDHGNAVHQILANYQMRRRGGDGFLRLMEFLPDGETVQVKTYSPVLDAYKTDEENQFVLKLSPAAEIEVTATTGAP